MKLSIFVIFSFLLVTLSTGCMTVLLTSEGVEKPVDMTSNVNKKFTIVKHFERELKGYFVVFNLITVSDPNIKNAMQDELLNGKGDAIINVKIKGQTTFLDGCLSVGVGILGGLALPPYGVYLGDLIGARTYTIEGDVIRYID